MSAAATADELFECVWPFCGIGTSKVNIFIFIQNYFSASIFPFGVIFWVTKIVTEDIDYCCKATISKAVDVCKSHVYVYVRVNKIYHLRILDYTLKATEVYLAVLLSCT